MPLKIKQLEREDNVESLFHLFKKNNLITPNYPHCRNIWNFQYLDNPEKKDWNVIIFDENHDAILGCFGLIPFPLKIYSKVFRAGYISGLATDEGIRRKLLSYKGTRAFATFPLIEEGCQNAFKEGVPLIFVFSVIPFSFWELLHFHNLSVEMKTTWHMDCYEFYHQYVDEFQDRIKIGWQRLLIKPYALFITSLQILLKKSKIYFWGFNTKENQEITVEAFKDFDESFKPLFASFYAENPQLITYDRDLRYLNWRFSADQYWRFKFFKNGRFIGYCIILKEEQEEREGFGQMYEFIILKEHVRRLPEILKLLFQKGVKFKFTHYLSCPYSQELFNGCSQAGYQLLFAIPEILRGRAKKVVKESSFYFRLNPDFPLMQQFEENLKDEKNWFINPLFFGPRYYPSNKVEEAV